MSINTSSSSAAPSAALAPRTTTIMAVAAGLAVANVYAIQPLLDMIGQSLTMRPSQLGIAVTFTQLGYAAGLVLLVPLGDMLDRTRLIVGQTALSGLALAATALVHSQVGLLMALTTVGLLAVTVQTLVAYAGALAPPDKRGATVGKVTGGVVIGILAARFISGTIGDVLGWRAVYLLAAVACAWTALTLHLTLPADRGRRAGEGYRAILRSLPGLLAQDRVLRLRGAFAFIIFAAFSTFWAAMVLPLTQAPYCLSHMQVGLFGVVGLAGALGARAAGRLADRGWGEEVTGAALLLLCTSWLPIVMLPRSLVWLGVGIVALDLAVQAVHVTSQTLIVERHPEAAGRVIAVYMMFYSLGSAAGGALSTFAFILWGWTGVCIAGGCISTAGFILWMATRSKAGGSIRS